MQAQGKVSLCPNMLIILMISNFEDNSTMTYDLWLPLTICTAAPVLPSLSPDVKVKHSPVDGWQDIKPPKPAELWSST